jgi:hypothetical protein
MFGKIGKAGASLAVLAAIAVGASGVAGAASSNNSSTTSSSSATHGPPGKRLNHKPETPLTGDKASKVKQAALGKVSGGSIIRVETDSDSSSPYEAHVQKSDGSQVIVLVNKQFEATAVNAFGGPPR